MIPPYETGALGAAFSFVAQVALWFGIDWAMSQEDTEAVAAQVEQDPLLASCLQETVPEPLTPGAIQYFTQELEGWKARAVNRLSGNPLALASVQKTIAQVAQKTKEGAAGVCGVKIGLMIIDRQITQMEKITPPPSVAAPEPTAAKADPLIPLAIAGAALLLFGLYTYRGGA
jgi:hypothetical protein